MPLIGTPNIVRSAVNWPHAVACLLVAVTALLLGFGALVTTYDAAMAVPDWPGTYGHNMFLFPLTQWLSGPWDLFLEHGHRLLGALVGVLSLLLAAVTWRRDAAPAVRALVIAAVMLVIVQGLLGGMRVLLDDKTVAKVHACTGPLFFAVAIAIATLTRRMPAALQINPPVRGVGFSTAGDSRLLPSWAVGAAVPKALVVAAYLQLVAGAQLRHIDATITIGAFRWMVVTHLVGAAMVTVLAALATFAWQPHEPVSARRWSWLILSMVFGQLLLGAGAWAFTSGVPVWLQGLWTPTEAVVARSPRGAIVITGHALLGMMILGSSVVMALEWGSAEALGGLIGPNRRRQGVAR
ncbi:MAG: hypothetical protein DWH79_11090 [Planctomycetota bacterium]|nr:MAG: hypothetical protein DWH79_11090 [Planctomycetota bacterium]